MLRIFGGTYKNRRIISPLGYEVRPSSGMVRQALFNILMGQIEGAHFLDLFAGSGAVGLEALSRGADRVTFVESNRDSLKAIHENIEQLGCNDQVQIISGDVLQILKRLSSQTVKYDIIFADPPYDMTDYVHKVIHFIDESTLLKPSGDLYVEGDKTLQTVSEGLTSLTPLEVRRYGKAHLHPYTKGKV